MKQNYTLIWAITALFTASVYSIFGFNPLLGIFGVTIGIVVVKLFDVFDYIPPKQRVDRGLQRYPFKEQPPKEATN